MNFIHFNNEILFNKINNLNLVTAAMDFSFMGGFVTSGIILAFVASFILLISSEEKEDNPLARLFSLKSVSYTHLTLPTNREV